MITTQRKDSVHTTKEKPYFLGTALRRLFLESSASLPPSFSDLGQLLFSFLLPVLYRHRINQPRPITADVLVSRTEKGSIRVTHRLIIGKLDDNVRRRHSCWGSELLESVRV